MVEGLFSGKPLSDGSYFINESGERFGEILERLRGDTRSEEEILSDKMVTYLPPEMLEIEVTDQRYERYEKDFVEYMRKWISNRGLAYKLSATRTESGPDVNAYKKRFMYYFDVIPLANSDEPLRVISDMTASQNSTLISVMMMMSQDRIDGLIERSPIEFLVDLRSGQRSVEIGDVVFLISKDKAMMSMKEISFEDVEIDEDVGQPILKKSKL